METCDLGNLLYLDELDHDLAVSCPIMGIGFGKSPPNGMITALFRKVSCSGLPVANLRGTVEPPN